MPIPDKRKNEDKQNFVARCMGDETMKKEYPDNKQRIAICLSQSRPKGQSNLLEEVHDNLMAENFTWDDNWNEFVWDTEITEIVDFEDKLTGKKSTKETKKKVTLNKPRRTPDGPKKFSVYVKNDKGNIVKVNFGDPNMEIKRDDPDRRKSYRARHNCDNPGPKWKANYWSCKMWSSPKVSDLT
jgi:hypothetical protein